MSLLVQPLIAGALCLLAGAYLAFRAYRAFAGRSGGCGGGGCSSCSSDKSVGGAKLKTLLPLDVPPKL